MNVKKIKTTALIYLIGLILITSCSKPDNTPTINNQTQVEDYVETGSWIITKFIDSGDDETNHFTDFIFTFGIDGSIVASNGISTFNGTWSITDSNSNDDSPDDLEFNIHFNLSNDFEDLNDDWDLISQSKTKIELIHVSGGNGGTDYLTFEKN